VPVRFSYTITRNPPGEDDSEDIAAVVTGENTVDIKPEDQDVRNGLIEILLNGTTNVQARP
jgi:outer membrane receptor for monomeric catechols